MNDLKYNYVLFGYDTDLYRIPYTDISKLDNAIYLHKPIDTDNKLLHFLHKVHTTGYINKKLFPLPFKGIWNPVMFRNRWNDSKPICFVFSSRRCDLVNYGLLDYLRKHYPGCKFACFYQDIVATCKECSIERVKKEFDVVLSFDHADAKNYGFYYYPLVYSVVDVPENPDIEESDVFFVGVPKDRLDDIYAAYEKVRDGGLKCDFHLIGVPKDKRRYEDEIHYRDTMMPYTENLQHIKRTRCILEIMQKRGTGFTLRAAEAVVFDRKLLTNNSEAEGAPFYKPDAVCAFTTPDTIDINFVKSGDRDVDYGYKDRLSPIHLLEFIEEKITE